MKAALMIISMLSCLMAGAGNKEYTLNQSVKQNEILFLTWQLGRLPLRCFGFGAALRQFRHSRFGLAWHLV